MAGGGCLVQLQQQQQQPGQQQQQPLLGPAAAMDDLVGEMIQSYLTVRLLGSHALTTAADGWFPSPNHTTHNPNTLYIQTHVRTVYRWRMRSARGARARRRPQRRRAGPTSGALRGCGFGTSST